MMVLLLVGEKVVVVVVVVVEVHALAVADKTVPKKMMAVGSKK
jgi:hypothetical protein